MNTSSRHLPRKHRWTLLFCLLLTLLAAMPIAIAFARQGGSVDLRRNVIASGGNTSTGSGNKQVSGTSGQGAAGAQSSGGAIVVKSGFWHTAIAPAAPTPEAGPGRFAFTAATYAVNEACTEAVVSINRVNGASVAASVDYNVTNGTGYTPCNVNNGMGAQNCDFSYTTGTLSFGVGETSKTLGVLISKDAYLEGNEQINFSLSNPTNGATLGGPSAATLTVVDNAAVPTNSQPIDDTATFVNQHYHDFLARSPDPGGAAFWQSQITQCGADQNCIRAKRLDVSKHSSLSWSISRRAATCFAFIAQSMATINHRLILIPPTSTRQRRSPLIPSFYPTARGLLAARVSRSLSWISRMHSSIARNSWQSIRRISAARSSSPQCYKTYNWRMVWT